MTFDQSIKLIENWLNQSTIKDKNHIIHTIDLFKNDHSGNNDPLNHVQVEELLPRVMNLVKDYDPSGIDLFLQNLGEISELGSCPQGRTTRLLGFYIPYKT